jgi:hypothetical protein
MVQACMANTRQSRHEDTPRICASELDLSQLERLLPMIARVWHEDGGFVANASNSAWRTTIPRAIC